MAQWCASSRLAGLLRLGVKMRFISVICAVLFTSSAYAEAYECQMRHKGTGGWIGDNIVLAMDREEEVGGALDWAIYEVHKTAIPVDVKKRKDHVWRFQWSVQGIKAANAGIQKLTYTAVLNTKRKAVSVRGRLHGSDNQISGSGPCKRIS